MCVPADGVKGIKQFVLESIVGAGGKPCPPGIVGVGIGGTADYAMYLAKEAITRPIGTRNPDPVVAQLEDELYGLLNETGIGPMGLGGDVTVLQCHIEHADTHMTLNPSRSTTSAGPRAARPPTSPRPATSTTTASSDGSFSTAPLLSVHVPGTVPWSWPPPGQVAAAGPAQRSGRPSLRDMSRGLSPGHVIAWEVALMAEHRLVFPRRRRGRDPARCGPGDEVLVDGHIIGIRDRTQIRIFDQGVAPPMDLAGAFLLHTAPNVRKLAPPVATRRSASAPPPRHARRASRRGSARSSASGPSARSHRARRASSSTPAGGSRNLDDTGSRCTLRRHLERRSERRGRRK